MQTETARPTRDLRWRCGLTLALAVAACLPAGAQAPVQEEVVEAAYLHKFAGFVDWPAEAFRTPASPIVVAVAGAPRVYDELVKVARGRSVLGRPVEARLLHAADLPEGVHVLFIGRGAAAEAAALVAAASKAHVLTVTDLSTGLDAGAILDFVQVDGRLRFEASLGAARRADIRLSSKLLSVAARVAEDAP